MRAKKAARGKGSLDSYDLEAGEAQGSYDQHLFEVANRRNTKVAGDTKERSDWLESTAAQRDSEQLQSSGQKWQSAVAEERVLLRAATAN